MKQTSIEWLVKELNQVIDFIPLSKWDKIADIVQQAKQMHKEEIVGAINDSWNMAKNSNFYNAQAEQYYNETYGGNK